MTRPVRPRLTTSSDRARRHRLATVALLTASLAVAGCGSSGSTDHASGKSPAKSATNTPASKGPHTINVSISGDGCSPTAITAPSGPAVFKVVSTGGASVTEFEVRHGATIIGEAEHVQPGSPGGFSLTLQPGTYTIGCTNGSKNPTGTLTVNGQSAAATAADKAVLATYRAYLYQQTALLTSRTAIFTQAVSSGDRAKAMRLFAWTRIPYERVEPVSEAFGDLDPRIDNRINDVLPGDAFTGFHRIEQELWQKHTATGLGPLALQLSADVHHLEGRVHTLGLEPAQIANGAVSLLGEVSKSKITGEEDRYSHTDMSDFEANVEGSQTAFAAIKPLLQKHDPAAVATIDSNFARVLTMLKPYRRGTGFVTYTQLTNADKTKLSHAIDRLAEPLSDVPAALVANQE